MPLFAVRTALLSAAVCLTATACMQPIASRVAFGNGPGGRTSVRTAAVQLDAALASDACLAVTPRVLGEARLEVREHELEYELAIENTARLRLNEAVVVLVADTVSREIVLWRGEAYSKPRLRVRGIVGLPPGVSPRDVAAALRERRDAVQLRVVDDQGTTAACAGLRN